MTTTTIESNYKESNSLILDLENLIKKYNNLLTSYRQAVINYVNYLKSNTSTSTPMVSIKGSTYWGVTGITQTNSSTLQQCQALCASTKGCSGATFNASVNGKPLCSLRSGDSSISSGGKNDYAILPQGKYLLSIVDSINRQLTEINQQIQEKTIYSDELYNLQEKERRDKTDVLVNQYSKLIEDRTKIEKAVKEYESLNETEKDTSLAVKQNYYSFLLLLVRVIVIIIILYGINNWANYFIMDDSNSNKIYVFILSCIVILFLFMPFRI